MRLPTTILLACLAFAPMGCGSSDDLQRVVVSGRVTFKGQPVEFGQLRFKPESSTRGPVTIAPVREGKYLADNQGGVPVGEHIVEILSYDMKAVNGKWPDGPGSNPPPQILPAKFNTQSQLTVSIDGTKAITHDFDLTP